MNSNNDKQFSTADYKVYITLNESDENRLQEGVIMQINNQDSLPLDFLLKINSKSPLKGGFNWIVRDFKKLLQALLIPFKNSASRAKLLAITFVYALLTPSGLASFFVRGWRFEVVKRMGEGQPGIPIAPSVNSLAELGENIREGVKLLGAKAAYDIPKIILLVAIGYDHFEMIIDWTYFFFGKIFGDSEIQNQAFNEFASSSIMNLSTTLIIQLLFILIYSFFFTPAFRITMIKYAKGNIEYKRFFSIEELRDSFKIYRRYKIRTSGAYIWDLLVSTLSMVIGFFLLVFFPIITWIFIPFYKLIFKHWPKAYGYGLLARKLNINGEI